MPIFEFRCGTCGTTFSTLMGMTAEPNQDHCPECGSGDIAKLVSRFAKFRSEDSRIDEVADRLEAQGEPESAAEMRDLVREMGAAMDDDMADEMEEMFEADMEGEDEPFAN
jgi:putative FmdB family regulatory protein